MKLSTLTKCLSVIMLTCPLQLQASDSQLGLRTQPISFRLGYEQYSMPPGYETLGVADAAVLLNLTENWYSGLGLDMGVKGQHGGYFAINADAGFTHPIFDQLWFDVGSKIGAGGGRATPVGGGLFLEPHAGLSYHFKYFNLGANYSYVNFTSGDIKSQQLQLVITVPTSIDVANAAYAGSSVNIKNQSLCINENYFGLTGEYDFPDKSSTNFSGQPDTDSFQLVGIELGHYFHRNGFVFLRGMGAFNGHSNGYAIITAGPGYELPISSDNRLNLTGRLGLGSAGGADINTGGGFVVQPQVGVEYYFTDSFSAEVGGSYIYAPDGKFRAAAADAEIKYHFDVARSSNLGYYHTTPSEMTYQAWRIRLHNETYFNPKSSSGQTYYDTQLANLNIDYWVNRYFYFTGQAAFAYAGYRTGGYFSGMLGAGVQTNLFNSRHLGVFAEGLLGTAGGAGLDIGEGAIGEPLVGINYQINPSWGFQASVGQLIAFKGDFNSTVMNFGVTYTFALLQ